jgi:hypothetical protein
MFLLEDAVFRGSYSNVDRESLLVYTIDLDYRNCKYVPIIEMPGTMSSSNVVFQGGAYVVRFNFH